MDRLSRLGVLGWAAIVVLYCTLIVGCSRNSIPLPYIQGGNVSLSRIADRLKNT